MAKQAYNLNEITREDFLEVFGNKFTVENTVKFSSKDFSFEVEPRLIIGKDLDGKPIAKLRINFKCLLNENGGCELTNGKGEKFILKNYPFSRSIEFPVSLEQFPILIYNQAFEAKLEIEEKSRYDERALHDWAREIVEGFQNTLPELLVEAAKAHFLTVGSIISGAHNVLPDFEKSNDLFHMADQAARHFEKTEKKICNLKHLRKNAPFANAKEFLGALDKAANSLRKRNARITQEKLAQEIKCNDERTLRVWVDKFGVDYDAWKKKYLAELKAAMIEKQI